MRQILTDSEVLANKAHLDKTVDLVDQLIDLTLNHRQSGHPGGSRSKVQLFLGMVLSGAMRFDVRRPEAALGDRFVLGAGHCTPLLYSVLALLNEFMLAAHASTGDAKYKLHSDPHRVLVAHDLLDFRRNGGLAGHAEMEGKTLFIKANTGPSGHGIPAGAGEAMALVHAGAKDVNVFAMDGEGGLSAGSAHETKNSAFGLGLENYVMLLDWNDYGIDDTAHSRVVNGTPETWFKPYGWRVEGTEDGADFVTLIQSYRALMTDPNKGGRPGMLWAKTRKGRGYGVYDNKSHGVAHKPNSDIFWETKRPFQEKYGVAFEGFGEGPPDAEAFRAQTKANIDMVIDVMTKDPELVEFVTGRLMANAAAVPTEPEAKWWSSDLDPAQDARIKDISKYPTEIFAKPGDKQPNRAALGQWGAYVNAVSNDVAGRPLFLVCAADLAGSTNIAGFAKGFDGFDGFGWYDRENRVHGSVLPQQITEFSNSAITSHLASVNFAKDGEKEFLGYYGACSTYGSFSYLKYGPMRLFSQLAQDSQIKSGKVLWVVGHSGPETAEDSRTHFGIFSPSVTELFPKGHIIDLHPYDYNEVLSMMAAAMSHDAHIIALHLTRPGVEIQDREALGAGSYLDAAKGAYVLKDWDDAAGPRRGTVIFRGTSPVQAAFQLIADHLGELPNVKFVAAPSVYLFDQQTQEYRDSVLPWDEWQNSMVVTNNSRRSMQDWSANKACEEYAVSPDFDDRWRTGGSLDEILEEAHLTWPWVLKGIQRFADETDERLARIRAV